jgi:hypothetical protein
MEQTRIPLGRKASAKPMEFPNSSGKNWLKTVPGKGYFVGLRLYGPTKAFFDKTWKPGDITKEK